MRFLDAILVISLAEKIHNTDEAIRKTARSCLKTMVSKTDRALINSIINSKRPTLHVQVMLRELPEYILRMGWDDRQQSPVKGELPLKETLPSPAISQLSPLASAFRR